MKKHIIYAVDSVKTYKERLMKEKNKFDENRHEIVIFDVKQLFPSVNVKRVIAFIMKQFTKNPKIFFDFKDQNRKSLPPPPLTKFREFLEAVLT